ncbi:hypothetical protein [Chryseobacterium daeguense]|uniref:hypothetical protein n=1 Tax=Chryseobacterium daeguense TaxID=412438 RepID=UPI00040BDA6A|nr:hypothetical protein [Chryseobacterium daeguense]
MQNKYPQKPGLDFILKQAFFYWNKTLMYQLIFSIIYFAIFFTSIFFFASRYGILEQQQELMEAFKVSTQAYLAKANELGQSENSQYFSYAFLGTLVFLYPLNLGFFQIFRKIDLNEEIRLGDLFVGYNGFNFFKYLGYYLFWFMVYIMVLRTVILPVVLVCATLFVAPIMFFMNKTIFESISLNFKALKMYFLEIVVCVMVSVLFKYIGFAIFFIGGLFTFPFWNAMIYSLYKTIFSEKR